MVEGREIDPYLLTPEYWDGHGPGDDCEPTKLHLTPAKILKNLRNGLREEKYARSVLKDFIKTPNKTPLRHYRDGQVFDASELPAGTIVQFSNENLDLVGNGATEYTTQKFWGVITESEDGNKRLRKYEDGMPMIGFPSRPTITVGEVRHAVWGKHSNQGVLSRINSMAMYEVGSGVREKTKFRVTMPKLRVLFPKPQSGNA